MISGFAEVVLGLSIPLTIGLFFTMRPLTALLLVALGSEMFLPVGPTFKVPYFVPLSKDNLPYLCALIGCALACPGKFRNVPKRKVLALMAFIALLAGALNGLTNGEVLVNGPVVRQAMTLKDGFFVAVASFFAPLIAFFLAYVIVKDSKDINRLLTGFAVAGLIYCPFAIIEMRMSPQFHNWVYGYCLRDFTQSVRWGGYRPQVFMVHGLNLARFFLATSLALFVIAKRRHALFGIPVRILAYFHLFVLILCRSTGAIALGLLGYLFIRFAKPRRQLLLASVLALVTLLYPLLRASDLFPMKALLDAASAVSEDRSSSLAFRFKNEDMLLEHARKKVLFGWGTYSRNRVFDAEGYDVSTTDGHWIIVLGSAGLIGFLLSMGPLVWPCVWAGRRRTAKFETPIEEEQFAGLALILALTTVDLIPNSLFGLSQYVMAGTLMRGLVEVRRRNQQAPDGREELLLRSGSQTSARG